MYAIMVVILTLSGDTISINDVGHYESFVQCEQSRMVIQPTRLAALGGVGYSRMECVSPQQIRIAQALRDCRNDNGRCVHGDTAYLYEREIEGFLHGEVE